MALSIPPYSGGPVDYQPPSHNKLIDNELKRLQEERHFIGGHSHCKPPTWEWTPSMAPQTTTNIYTYTSGGTEVSTTEASLKAQEKVVKDLKKKLKREKKLAKQRKKVAKQRAQQRLVAIDALERVANDPKKGYAAVEAAKELLADLDR